MFFFFLHLWVSGPQDLVDFNFILAYVQEFIPIEGHLQKRKDENSVPITLNLFRFSFFCALEFLQFVYNVSYYNPLVDINLI